MLFHNAFVIMHNMLSLHPSSARVDKTVRRKQNRLSRWLTCYVITATSKLRSSAGFSWPSLLKFICCVKWLPVSYSNAFAVDLVTLTMTVFCMWNFIGITLPPSLRRYDHPFISFFTFYAEFYDTWWPWHCDFNMVRRVAFAIHELHTKIVLNAPCHFVFEIRTSTAHTNEQNYVDLVGL